MNTTKPRPQDRVLSDTGLYCGDCGAPASAWDGTTGWYAEGDIERPLWSPGCCPDADYVDEHGNVVFVLPPSAEDY
jgi:hypothetical protein